MRFEVGKQYTFTYDETLREKIRGKKFSPLVIGSDVMRIQIYDEDGSIIPSPDGLSFWNADPPHSNRWEKYVYNVWGKSILEFKFV